MTEKSDGQSPLIVIISNRGPFSFSRDENGGFTYERGQGGLVTALAGLVQDYEVLWVAAALSEDDEAWAKANNDEPQMVDDTRLQLVRLDSERYEQYYSAISNPLLWFIQHQLWDTPRKPDIDKTTWEAWHEGYVAINKQIADAVYENVKDYDGQIVILPQDYHLYMVPQFLRERIGERAHIQPFVHIPWPGPDAWRILPAEMRNAILRSLMQADFVGFQTTRDAFNFVQTCRFYVEGAHSRGSRDSIEYDGRKIYARAYPISINVERLEELAEERETRLWKSKMINLTGDSQIILRVDRIEPSKNILRGLQAFEDLLVQHPEHQGKVQMLMLLVPSRMEVDEYQSYLQQIMAKAGLMNAQYSDAFWEPVQVIVGNNYPRAIAAFQMFDVLLVNPIADGMNLVAKEGMLLNRRNGVLVLSENAGAFYELGDNSLVVSPFDIYSISEAMHAALTMSASERERRAVELRDRVKKADVKKWFRHQLDDALDSQSRNDSTPEMPSTEKSDDSNTAEGVSSEATPTPKA